MPHTSTQPIDEIRYEKIRKLEELRARGINPFPSASQFTRKTIISAREADENKVVAVAGRITSLRGHGKIKFADLEDQTGTIQTAFKFDLLGQNNMEICALLDVGDFVEVQGSIFTTDKGELTIKVIAFNLLAKALRPIPDSREGFKDKELRLRKRYLDLLLNENTRRIFEIRHQLTRGIRKFLDQQGLTEVETPVLQPLYGGANAKPFTTHINSLESDAYLRIASELYLKRLMITQTRGVYDIAKDFRNEGVDQTHFPEFTMLEAYLPYADYHGMMSLMEKMMRHLAQQSVNTTLVEVGTDQIDLARDWPRTPMTDLIRQNLAVEIEKLKLPEITDLARKHNLDLPEHATRGELIFLIFDKTISPKLINPHWVIDYPIEVSPLAKEHREKEGFVERFELYIGGKEIMDGWSEINDPLAQRARFEAEEKRELDETEAAQPIDEDYLEAMEYGMPPMAGVGVGIDRLTMFFSNTWSIQETILFPFKKPLSKNVDVHRRAK